MCGDDADVRERIRHAVSVALMLVNTAVVCVTKSRQNSVLRGFCVLAMSMGGEAEASIAENGDSGKSVPKAHSTDTPERQRAHWASQ